MAKFRAPSTSVASSAFASTSNVHDQAKPLPGPSKLHKMLAGQRHARTDKLDKAEFAVKDAAKRNHKTMKIVDPSTLFVGNIGPNVDERALRAHFSGCGNILSAKIHCCGGIAMTIKPPPPSYHKNQRVRQYGIITFETKIGRRKALDLMGSSLDGRSITVSLSICDLPEVKEKILRRMADYHKKFVSPDIHHAKKSVIKSLKLDPTVLLDPSSTNAQQGAKDGRPRIFGFSLHLGVA
ncbi:hypothetical protein BDN67DRAFT_966065 [Paxillus ammoniavirescens]|nr:hypothetical protein BDN67DRAFT_966065 [Paxillus ammoniavirescens]